MDTADNNKKYPEFNLASFKRELQWESINSPVVAKCCMRTREFGKTYKIVKWQLMLTVGAQDKKAETKFTMPASVKVRCCFENMVYVALNFLFLTPDSSQQHQTTELLIDWHQISPLRLNDTVCFVSCLEWNYWPVTEMYNYQRYSSELNLFLRNDSSLLWQMVWIQKYKCLFFWFIFLVFLNCLNTFHISKICNIQIYSHSCFSMLRQTW